MQIKVCGMKYPDNIRELSVLDIDYMGFIFYSKSRRYVGDPDPEILASIPERIQKTGVFVNEKPEILIEKSKHYKLDLVQLHGEESPAEADFIKKAGIPVMKAFHVGDPFDFQTCAPYTGICDWFLFDTPATGYGGSGKKFNWQLLKNYRLDTPFLLSGGIGPGDAGELRAGIHEKMRGIDLNSRFEREPGRKDINKTTEFITQIRGLE